MMQVVSAAENAENEVNATDSAALIKQIPGLLLVCLTRRGSKSDELLALFLDGELMSVIPVRK